MPCRSNGVSPHQTTLPVSLSKATNRQAPRANDPHDPWAMLTITSPESQIGPATRPPYPVTRPYSSVSWCSHTVLPDSASRQTRNPAVVWA